MNKVVKYLSRKSLFYDFAFKVALDLQTSHNRAPQLVLITRLMVASNGPLATVDYESRQARKGATVVVTLGAEVWLLGVIAIKSFRTLDIHL